MPSCTGHLQFAITHDNKSEMGIDIAQFKTRPSNDFPKAEAKDQSNLVPGSGV